MGACTCGGASRLTDGAPFGPCSTVPATGFSACAGPLLQHLSKESPRLGDMIGREGGPEDELPQPFLVHLRPWDVGMHAVQLAAISELRMLRKAATILEEKIVHANDGGIRSDGAALYLDPDVTRSISDHLDRPNVHQRSSRDKNDALLVSGVLHGDSKSQSEHLGNRHVAAIIRS